jgi:hypothetical protein
VPSLETFEFVRNLALGIVVELLGGEIGLAERCGDPSAILASMIGSRIKIWDAYLLTRISSFPSTSKTNLTPFLMLSSSTTSIPRLWFLIKIGSRMVHKTLDSRNEGALPLVSSSGFLEDIYSPTSDVYFCTAGCEALGNYESS